ncbi:Piso0_000774 [Millerozyma farinosa CBS 7064]|uniref:Protein transport protein SEC23 n=1 Tax=Pichia sorbitophila (strain ATCC MYA-4447 / BCRC 22081 / CBS 7064 / NBRC 10061 / NRRL Y-12695) TaxID=559304 RepID=G8YQ10_PICSO|nr:Piso0_000774 [Millerozyma farinosa CBS 7064]
MDVYEKEEKDGIRLSWNCVPRSKLQHQRNIIPLAALYTPLNNKTPTDIYQADQIVTCRQCRAFINPYVFVHEQQPDVWNCSFCHFPNRIPLQNGQIPPAGINSDSSTIEYVTGRVSRLPPIFFYVVDTCFEVEDLETAYGSLKESIKTSLSLLPDDALVGFISYGKNVALHELTSDGFGRSHYFNGAKEYTPEQLQKALGLLSFGLRVHHEGANKPGASLDNILGAVASKFLQPVSRVEYQLSAIIDDLVPNLFSHPVMKERPIRATGSAINIAALLLHSILGDSGTTGGHLLCFIGGACTYGPGKIVGHFLKEPLRSHHDIDKSNSLQVPSVPLTQGSTKVDLSLVKHAKAFYEKITHRLVSLGMSCNFFIGSYDQVGLYEMDEVCYKTGGSVVMCDSFNTAIFKQSLMKFFSKHEEDEYFDMGFNGSLECRTTLDLQIQGLIGTATALPPKKDARYIDPTISKIAIGEGNTNAWKLCSVNPQSTYAIYFDKGDSPSVGFSYIQFIFHYQHPSGELRLRVTTIPIAVLQDVDSANLEVGFDQEAATILMARESISKLQPARDKSRASYDPADVLKQIDKVLIDYCARFSLYTKGSLESFRLSPTYAMLPQFIYYLRRSAFIQVFNNSPDETSYIRHIFMHEDVESSLIMVQPTLLSFDIDTFGTVDEDTGVQKTEPDPVLLDSLSLGPSKILLLDTFFHILIYHGSRVAEWRKAGYQDMEEYEHFREFLEAPKREAMSLLVERFPLPRFIDCDEGGSQARFLMAKLNPSTSYVSSPNQMYGHHTEVLTDDASLQSFMDHVKRIVVLRK